MSSHTYAHPEVPPKYEWRNGRDSVVKITSILSLPPRGDMFPLVLKIQRRFLETVFKEGPLQEDEGQPFDFALKQALEREKDLKELNDFLQEFQNIRPYYFCRQIALHLKDISEKGPVRREKAPSFRVFPSSKVAKFTIDRGSLPLLKKFFSSPAQEGFTHIKSLTILIQSFYLDKNVIRRIINPARAREFKKQIFADLLHKAYPDCWTLVDLARSKDDLESRIKEIVDSLKKSDERVRNYLSEVHERPGKETDWGRYAASLVYWGFYGAWEKFGLVPLRDPKDIGRDYIYGESFDHLRHLFKKATEIDPSNYDKVVGRLKELYLSERGSAARAFGLL